MLHLFKKVYVESDAVINVNVDRIVISQEHGNPLLSGIKDSSTGELLGHGHTFEDLIGNGGQFSNFLELLTAINAHCNLHNKPIHLYVDKDSFLKVVTYWYKALFKNLTADGLDTIVRSHAEKEKNLGYFIKSKSSKPTEYQKFVACYSVNKSDIVNSFESVTDDFSSYSSFINLVIDELSTEILLSAYLYDSSNKEVFRKKAATILSRDTTNLIIERRELLLDNILKEQTWNAFNLPPVTLENYDNIFTNNALSSFFGTDIYNGNNIIWATLKDSDKLAKFKTDYLTIISLYDHQTENSPDLKQLDLINYLVEDQLSDAGVNAFVQFEIEHPGYSIIADFERHKFNLYFLDYVLEPIRAGQTDRSYLAPFQLRTA